MSLAALDGFAEELDIHAPDSLIQRIVHVSPKSFHCKASILQTPISLYTYVMKARWSNVMNSRQTIESETPNFVYNFLWQLQSYIVFFVSIEKWK